MLATTWSGVVHADANADTARMAARSLGEQGVDLYERGDYLAASEKLSGAYELVKIPSLAVWLARALREQGKWVQAAERFREATQLPITSGDMAQQRKFQEEAILERQQLAVKIPKVTIRVTGSTEYELYLDESRLPKAVAQTALAVDPGSHRIEAVAGERKASEHFTVAASETLEVTLRLDTSGAPLPQVGPAALSPAATTTPRSEVSGDAPGKWQRIAGWSALGLGGLGLMTWGVTGALALGQRSKLSDDCPNHECPRSAYDTLDRYQLLRTTSTVGFFVGVAGIGLGTTLLLTLPRPAPAVTAQPLQIYFSGTTFGVSGGFE